MFDDSYSYDPTDYPSENSIVNVDNKHNVNNIIDDHEEPKSADIIEWKYSIGRLKIKAGREEGVNTTRPASSHPLFYYTIVNKCWFTQKK